MPQDSEQTILIVDDNPLNIDVLVEILGRDHRLHVATGGELALKIVEQERPDLVLLDVMMPEMDGFEVCRTLQAHPEFCHIPVIFVTAMDDSLDETKGFQAGCVDYITKPVNPAIVKARVGTHLHLRQARQALIRRNRELREVARLREDMERVTRHDLKNPLTGVFSGVELLESCGYVNAEQKEYIDIIKESAHKVLQLINFSLDLFKMEQKIYRLVPVDVAILEILHRIEQELSGLIRLRESGVRIRVNGGPPSSKDPVVLRGEPLLFYSMLVNLIKNAVEAGPVGEKVDVDLTLDDQGARVEIHNQGQVPEVVRERFFDKYVTHGKTEGTGLGTYSARLIAHTLKGEISMTSSQADGTRIAIVWGPGVLPAVP